LKPIGGTAIYDALHKALALRPGQPGRPFMVIFLTDGKPTIGATDEDQIAASVSRDKAGNTRVFCFGIGTDVNTHLLDKITETTRAFSQYVFPDEDLEVKVSNFFTKVKDPVLADPKLGFGGGLRVTKLYPAPLPDLFKGEQLVLVGRYAGRGDCAIELSGMVNGKVQKFTYEVEFPERAAEHDFIPRLWATRRVGYLLDEIRLHGENKELRDEVTELARAYGIVTPYTAYLIVEDERQRNVPRTAQTAEAVANVAGMTMIEEPGLGAFRAGGFHDVPVSKAREAYPEWFEKAYPLQTYELAGGESAAAFFERVTEAFIEKVWDRFSETRDLNVVVVCHEETINALLHHFLGIEFTGFQTFKLDHTSITRLNSRMKRARITAVNDIAHLVMAGIPVGASGTGRAAS